MGQCYGNLSASPPPNPSPTSQNETLSENNETTTTNGQVLENPSLRVFSFSELKAATKNFKLDTVVGEGYLGKVFKGCIDEKIVAIKKLNSEILAHCEASQWEIGQLGRLRHPNLVRLLGHCSEDKHLLHVYEYMPKGSLADHLFRRNLNFEPLSWDRRLQIAIDTARGLAFLHGLDKNIIHRDIKSSSILLDGNYNAKISNLTLARSGPLGEDSHVSTRVMGTYGYAAPEYIATGHLYVKSDVYSFGVVMFEILTGLKVVDSQRSLEQQNLVEWAKSYMRSKKELSNIMDATMDGQYSPKVALRAVQVALNCTKSDHRERPSMKDVVEALEGIGAMSVKPKPI